MKREFLITGDGSTTIHLPDWNEQYHSKHGALAEAKHVFIETGLHHYIANKTLKSIAVLEIGFGTGLNALLTYEQSELLQLRCNYVGVEAYPVAIEEVLKLNYPSVTQISEKKFNLLHTVSWEEEHRLSACFSLLKRKQFFEEVTDKNAFQLIYFDAFGARVQPELWTEAIFSIMYNALQASGVLVTYAAKGSVRRAMQAVGFTVERLPGPPGKREMLRATKE